MKRPSQKSQVAVVTGGAQGIGRAICRRLIQDGFHVVAADCDMEAGKDLVSVSRHQRHIRFVHADVADERHIKTLFNDVRKAHGRLDLLVNNAGIGGFGPSPDALPLDQWNRVLAVNLTGPFLCSKYAIPLLRRRGGVIINIASTRALQSEPHSEAYAASKGGLVALTHALAISVGPRIRVHAISPGWIDVRGWQKKIRKSPPPLAQADHRQHPVGRVGCPEDIAALVAFLAAQPRGFITGQNIVIDGGMTRKMIYCE